MEHAYLDGRVVELDMTSYEAVTAEQLDAAAVFPRELARFDRIARAALIADRSEHVALYIDHHVEQLHLPEIERAPFVAELRLRRVGLYPASPHEVAVFDYILDDPRTTYVLAVKFDAAGAVYEIVMES
jgi:hypothetical protein